MRYSQQILKAMLFERDESYLQVIVSETSPRTGFWIKPKNLQS